jgi:hypothetical protein
MKTKKIFEILFLFSVVKISLQLNAREDTNTTTTSGSEPLNTNSIITSQATSSSSSQTAPTSNSEIKSNTESQQPQSSQTSTTSTIPTSVTNNPIPTVQKVSEHDNKLVEAEHVQQLPTQVQTFPIQAPSLVVAPMVNPCQKVALTIPSRPCFQPQPTIIQTQHLVSTPVVTQHRVVSPLTGQVSTVQTVEQKLLPMYNNNIVQTNSFVQQPVQQQVIFQPQQRVIQQVQPIQQVIQTTPFQRNLRYQPLAPLTAMPVVNTVNSYVNTVPYAQTQPLITTTATNLANIQGISNSRIAIQPVIQRPYANSFFQPQARLVPIFA